MKLYFLPPLVCVQFSDGGHRAAQSLGVELTTQHLLIHCGTIIHYSLLSIWYYGHDEISYNIALPTDQTSIL